MAETYYPVFLALLVTRLTITIIIMIMIPKSTSAASYLWQPCSKNSSTYAVKSSFATNLKTLLFNSFPTNAATNPSGFYNTSRGTGDGAVYGMFLCRGDQTTSGCSDCVINAARRERSQKINCPRTKAAILWYDECMVRYDNQAFAGTMNNPYQIEPYYYYSTNSIYSEAFEDLLGKTMNKLAVQAAFSPGQTGKKYANMEVKIDSNTTLYSMVQCTPDLSAVDCNKCLTDLIDNISWFEGGRLYNPTSCNVRYEIYPFLNTPFNSSSQSTQQEHHRAGPIATGDTTVKRRKQSSRTSLLVASPTIAALMLILLCFGTWICLRKRKAMERYDVEIDADSLHFDLSILRSSTNNFSPQNKLGEGGFGEVYKGKLQSGQEVAIKKLSETSGQGVAEFRAEVILAAKLQHKNLVKLLGFCVTSKEKILVYEYLPNSSLDRFLFDSTKNVALVDWQTRLDIMVGIARGLLYLHEDSRIKVIHRDLKTSNILLDEAMKPKISDFGLAKLFGVDQTQGETDKIVGTYGYMAPEYAITGHYSVKSDIYSFGVIVLEIVSGQKNRFFGRVQLEEAILHRAWRLWNEAKPMDLADPKLSNSFPTEEVLKCIHIGLLCVQEDAAERPTMPMVVAALTGQSVDFPMPKPPHFFGWASNTENHCTLNQHASSYIYTGTRTITDLCSRE